MHFYSFNIGDYASHTRHLTPMEDLAYRRLLDLYYLHEQPLNERSTTVARAINMREHEAEVVSVLEEFFELVDGTGWVNRRADEEIAKYHNRLEAASRAGKASAERRSNARSTDVQPNKKQETVNIKQETKINTRDKPLSCPDGVALDVWDGFLKVRKAKKAPVTATAIAGIEREARKAGWSLNAALSECCTRGWAGFKADWVKDEAAKKMSHNDASKLAAARAIFGDERNLNHGQLNTIDITPTQTITGLLGAEDFYDDAGPLRDEISKHVEDGSDFT
jgi:uncharacterized protein YdaU (DUF1376 family)